MTDSSPDRKRAFVPYSRPCLDADDLRAVADVLTSTTISQGEQLKAFEDAFAKHAGAAFATAFSSGTAAVHAMCHAAGLGPGDEVILPALTFAGTANAVRYVGATPVFADIDPSTNCISPDMIEPLVTDATRAVLSVDFAGQPANYDRLRNIAAQRGLLLLADAAHAAGARWRDRTVGSLADMTAFSFNPVKNITAAEGGMVTTNDPTFASHLRLFGSHGMTRDPKLLESSPPAGWYYEQQFLGYNYKLSELHAALGLSQLRKLDAYNEHRARLARYYTEELSDLPLILPRPDADSLHAWHLYVIRLTGTDVSRRDELFEHLRSEGFGVQLHYIPVPMHPDYRRMGYTTASLPETVDYFESAISLPLNPSIDEDTCAAVAASVRSFLGIEPRNGNPSTDAK